MPPREPFFFNEVLRSTQQETNSIDSINLKLLGSLHHGGCSGIKCPGQMTLFQVYLSVPRNLLLLNR